VAPIVRLTMPLAGFVSVSKHAFGRQVGGPALKLPSARHCASVAPSSV
jgi:hypothetical protein